MNCFQLLNLNVIYMKQVCKTNPKQAYSQQIYAEYHSLPPNLPLPNTSSIPLFIISIDSIVYLDQIKSSHQDIQLKLIWWGMDSPQILNFMLKNNQINAKSKYIICTPVQRFIAYLNDMKFLNIQISIRNRVLGKAYLNFLVMKGWKGQKFDGFLDIKYNNKKIGEMGYQLQIIATNNPYIANRDVKAIKNITYSSPFKKNLKQIDSIQASNSVNSSNMKEDNQNKDYRKQSTLNHNNERQYDDQNNKKSNTNSMYNNSIYNQNDNIVQNQLQPTYLPKHKQNINYNRHFNDQYNHHNHTIEYQKQMIRLAEDYNILFSKANPYQQQNTINHAEIQIIKLQIDNQIINDNIQIFVPLINAKQHVYDLSPGAIIKIVFNHNTTETEFVNYLKQCIITVKKQDRLQGSIRLTKILAKCESQIQIPLYEKKTKKDNVNKVAKGRLILKALSPHNSSENQANKPYINKQIQNQQNPLKEKKQDTKKIKNQDQLINKEEQYALFNIHKYHSIHPYPYQHTQNLFVQLYSQQILLASTKTIWNHAHTQCSFEENLTLKVNGPTVMIWVCDRKQNVIKLGYGLLDMKSAIGIDIQIPILSLNFRKQVIIGYLSFDYMKNGLQSISKIPALLNAKNIQKQQLIKQNKGNKKRQTKQNIIDEFKPFVQNQIIQKEINADEQEYDNVSQQMQEYLKQKQNKKQKKQQQQTIVKDKNSKTLSLLQIYNKLFTFIYTHPKLIELQTNISILAFLQHIQPHVSDQISSLSLNQIILHKLNPNSHSINTASLHHDFQSFCTYYDQLVQQKDNYLSQLLNIINQIDLDVNALEYELKKNKSFWSDLNQLLTDRKGNNINLIEHIRQYYQKDIQINHPNITIQQFCDALRHYQVYQTTKGKQISSDLISSTIYNSLVDLLISLEPYIEYFSYQQLKAYLDQEQILLSEWQLLNIEKYIASERHQRYLNNKIRQINLKHINMIQKYQKPSFISNKIEQQQAEAENHQNRSKQMKQYTKNVIKNNDSGKIKKYDEQQNNNKPTMTKSPTFGYLHPQPELLKKPQLETSQKMMVQSLALNMQNLPISPINYTTNKTIQNQPKAFFSNLKYSIEQLYINNIKINISHLQSQVQNNPSFQPENNSSKQKTVQKFPSNQMRSKERSVVEQRSWITVTDTHGEGENMEVRLWNVIKQFEYMVSVYFIGGQIVQLQCVSGQWTAIVSDDGQYLGTVLIN